MRKEELIIPSAIAVFLLFPSFASAANLDGLKADFLQGNYRRVILEASVQAGHFNIQGGDELNYILGLSYLKEEKIEESRDCLRRVMSNPISKFKESAALSYADTYLLSGQYQDAEELYRKLLEANPATKLKAAVLYRMSQSGYRKGSRAQFDEYLSRLKRDFPLNLEILSAGLPRAGAPAAAVSTGDFSVQVGFFTKEMNAVNFKNKLAARGYSVFVDGSKEGYRVKVGRFKTQSEALSMEKKLSEEGFPTKICP